MLSSNILICFVFMVTNSDVIMTSSVAKTPDFEKVNSLRIISGYSGNIK